VTCITGKRNFVFKLNREVMTDLPPFQFSKNVVVCYVSHV